MLGGEDKRNRGPEAETIEQEPTDPDQISGAEADGYHRTARSKWIARHVRWDAWVPRRRPGASYGHPGVKIVLTLSSGSRDGSCQSPT